MSPAPDYRPQRPISADHLECFGPGVGIHGEFGDTVTDFSGKSITSSISQVKEESCPPLEFQPLRSFASSACMCEPVIAEVWLRMSRASLGRKAV